MILTPRDFLAGLTAARLQQQGRGVHHPAALSFFPPTAH
jgi:hypothetical protein